MASPADIPLFIFRKTKIPLLHKSMNAYSLRQRTLADNIANADTPGFRRSEVKFEEDLKKVLKGNGVKGARTHEKHFQIGVGNVKDLKPRISLPDDRSLASGKNNVNIDKEMAELAKNSIRFQAASQLMSRTFTKLKSAIRGEAAR